MGDNGIPKAMPDEVFKYVQAVRTAEIQMLSALALYKEIHGKAWFDPQSYSRPRVLRILGLMDKEIEETIMRAMCWSRDG